MAIDQNIVKRTGKRDSQRCCWLRQASKNFTYLFNGHNIPSHVELNKEKSPNFKDGPSDPNINVLFNL